MTEYLVLPENKLKLMAENNWLLLINKLHEHWSFRELQENLAEEDWREPKDQGFVENYFIMLIMHLQ